MKVIVDRATWWRGAQGSALLRGEDNCKCCIGFFALQCGFKAEELKHVGTIGAVIDKAPEWVDQVKAKATFDTPMKALLGNFEIGDTNRHFYVTEAEWLSKAYDLNDSLCTPFVLGSAVERVRMTDEKRESMLITLFAENGHELVFEGTGNPTVNADMISN